jgi:ribose/xylose/arabinose/galactoside ABC-type transport system permease subunit
LRARGFRRVLRHPREDFRTREGAVAHQPAGSPGRGQQLAGTLFAIVGTINPRFLAERNLQSIFLGNAYIAVAAIGMSMVIISGNIDISVGSLIGVLATLSGTLAVSGYPIIVAWLAPLVVGALATALMGFLIAYLRIPSIVVTLGMLSILKGGLISATGGAWITNLPDGYALAQLRPLGLPMPIYFLLLLTIAAAIWMRYSATGRAIYAVGGNSEAARLSGLSRERTIMKVFIIHGVFVGIASVLFATQLSVIQSTVPPNLELTIITASVVGGVSILGGTGTVIGATLAAILLSAIGSSLIFINLSPYWLRSVQGVLILLTVLADLLRRRRQRRR